MLTGSITGVPKVGNMALTELVGRAQSRVMLQFSVDAGILYVTDLPGAAPLVGYPVTPQAPLILRVEDVGDLVTHAFFGSSSLGNAQAGTVEVFSDGATRYGAAG
jgi:hypothetical protein